MGCNTPISAPARPGAPLPPRFLDRLAGFADLFTRPTWSHVPLLLAGAILAPGRRTVTAACASWGGIAIPTSAPSTASSIGPHGRRGRGGRQLLLLLVNVFVPAGAPVVIGLDDTIERRWGPKISARGIYRDPVRSSKGHFVKASGLRWLSAMLLVRVPWADRIMALPFLTLLAPVQTLLCRQVARAQDAARLGPASRPANPPLAAGSLHRPGRRQRVRGHRVPRRRPQPGLRRHPLAPRCQPVRFPAAKAQRPRPTADQGQAS